MATLANEVKNIYISEMDTQVQGTEQTKTEDSSSGSQRLSGGLEQFNLLIAKITEMCNDMKILKEQVTSNTNEFKSSFSTLNENISKMQSNIINLRRWIVFVELDAVLKLDLYLLDLYRLGVRYEILRNGKKLKGEKIFISEDFPLEVRLIRKELLPYLNEARASNKKAYLRYDKLLIENKVCTLNDLKKSQSALVERQDSISGDIANTDNFTEGSEQLEENSSDASGNTLHSWLKKGRLSSKQKKRSPKSNKKRKALSSPDLSGNIYFKPGIDMIHILELLQLTLDELHRVNNDSIFLILGDFNSRVGALNQMDLDLFEGTNLNCIRISTDEVIYKQGYMLVDFFESNSFALLNGRTMSDNLGQKTFVSKVGSSVIDLAWCDYYNLDKVVDLSVLQWSTLSDHFPIEIKLNLPLNRRKVEGGCSSQGAFVCSRLSWDNNKAEAYVLNMENMPKISYNLHLETISNINENLKDAIWETAEHLGLVRKQKKNHIQVNNNDPWFDQQCKTAKKIMKENLKICKKK
uniref:Endonuclease/exonuclease/phosphatase domain-containing protein n=1 Tax=Rhodnius prolixus TaxID=13249 RepID=T1ID12_RHOPR